MQLLQGERVREGALVLPDIVGVLQLLQLWYWLQPACLSTLLGLCAPPGAGSLRACSLCFGLLAKPWAAICAPSGWLLRRCQHSASMLRWQLLLTVLAAAQQGEGCG